MEKLIEIIDLKHINLIIEIKVKKGLIQNIALYETHILNKKSNKIYSKIGPLVQAFFKCYFLEKKDYPYSLPINWSLVSEFQKKVYLTLVNHVPFGNVVSYSELARLLGNPKAARAVGMALSKNPWPIIIPCHRVICKDNSLGGFSCGVHIKKLLLSHENIYL